NDGVLQPTEQEAPTTHLDLGGKPKTRHALLGDIQAPVYRGNRLRHIVAIYLAAAVRVQRLEVDGLRQADVAVLLTGLHQLARVASVTGDVDPGLTAHRLL